MTTPPPLTTILWTVFSALILTGATSGVAIAISKDVPTMLGTGITAFCATLAVMLGIGPKIPSA